VHDRKHRAAISSADVASWILAGIALLSILKVRILSGVFSGLLVYNLIHSTAGKLPVSGKRAKIASVAILSAIVVAGVTLAIFGLAAFFRSDAGNVSVLLQKMAEIVDGSKRWLPSSVQGGFPGDAQDAKMHISEWFRSHAKEATVIGEEAGRLAIHILIGMVVGAIVALREAIPHDVRKPLTKALFERSSILAESFRRVVFAQVKISAINTVATSLYLAIALPLAGVKLPFTKTLIVITFVAGLLPVVGNLVSNVFIVVVSLGASLKIGVASLVFLILIHKMEYFLNARIVGSRIGASSWELLIAMFAAEAAFGIPGLVAAPIYYAYLKEELRQKGCV